MPGIFISHADSTLSVALDRLMRRALGNKTTVFNSSRAAAGLAAGQPIDVSLLQQIRGCDAFVWLTSPESASRSFWMAWELGAADAAERSIFPCRALGMEPWALPLLQSRRYVPDLGSRDELTQFLQTLADSLKLPDTTIAEAVQAFYVQYPLSTPFDAAVDNALEVTVAGRRAIVENKSESSISQLTFSTAEVDEAVLEQSLGLVDLLGTDALLGPRDRRLVAMGQVEADLDSLDRVQLLAKWIDESKGRRIQRVRVRVHR